MTLKNLRQVYAYAVSNLGTMSGRKGTTSINFAGGVTSAKWLLRAEQLLEISLQLFQSLTFCKAYK